MSTEGFRFASFASYVDYASEHELREGLKKAEHLVNKMAAVRRDIKVFLNELEQEVDGKLLKFMSKVNKRIGEIERKLEINDPEYKLSTLVKDYNFPVRALNAFKQENIIYLGDLVKTTEGFLMMTPNLGKVTVGEIKDVLKEMGLSLGMKVEDWDRPT